MNEAKHFQDNNNNNQNILYHHGILDGSIGKFIQPLIIGKYTFFFTHFRFFFVLIAGITCRSALMLHDSQAIYFNYTFVNTKKEVRVIST